MKYLVFALLFVAACDQCVDDTDTDTGEPFMPRSEFVEKFCDVASECSQELFTLYGTTCGDYANEMTSGSHYHADRAFFCMEYIETEGCTSVVELVMFDTGDQNCIEIVE